MKAILSLGSNSGDREGQIRAALGMLSRLGSLGRCSHLYETPALDGVSAPYINAVAEIETAMDAAALSASVKLVEDELGRDRGAAAKSSVIIDIDVVVADGEVLRPRDFAQAYFLIGYHRLGETAETCIL